MSNPNPNCEYITKDDIDLAKRKKCEDEDGVQEYHRSISRYDIDNALMEKHLPLSNDIHGPYKMMPPDHLHTSGSGLIMYMFESLCTQLGGGKDRDEIDYQHISITNLIKRQSERDFPHGSMRNRLIDGTKYQSSERKGNLFRLMCIAQTSHGCLVMQRSKGLSNGKWKKII